MSLLPNFQCCVLSCLGHKNGQLTFAPQYDFGGSTQGVNTVTSLPSCRNSLIRFENRIFIPETWLKGLGSTKTATLGFAENCPNCPGLARTHLALCLKGLERDTCFASKSGCPRRPGKPAWCLAAKAIVIATSNPAFRGKQATSVCSTTAWAAAQLMNLCQTKMTTWDPRRTEYAVCPCSGCHAAHALRERMMVNMQVISDRCVQRTEPSGQCVPSGQDQGQQLQSFHRKCS